MIFTEGRGVAYEDRTTLAQGNWDILFALENISFDDYMFYKFNHPVDMVEKESSENSSSNTEDRTEEVKASSRVKSTPLVNTALQIISANTTKRIFKAPSA